MIFRKSVILGLNHLSCGIKALTCLLIVPAAQQPPGRQPLSDSSNMGFSLLTTKGHDRFLKSVCNIGPPALPI